MSQPARFAPLRGLAAATALFAAVAACAAPSTPPDPLPVIDGSAAAPATAHFFQRYFAAKSSRDVDKTMGFFSPQLVTYIDATLGWDVAGFAALRSLFANYMPRWPASARSYPTRILGGAGSALVAFTDTPELFGAELRILGAVDFKDGKIVRWVDYWDSRGLDPALDAQLRTPPAFFPTDFHEDQVPEQAGPRMRAAVTRLHQALASGGAAGDLFTYDAVYEDMTARTLVVGRDAIVRYLGRVAALAPFTAGAAIRHVVGNDDGGGYEWKGKPDSGVRSGITALALDGSGRIARLTTVYDGKTMSDSRLRAMTQAALEP